MIIDGVLKDNYFSALYAIDVGDKIERKNGLSYLSWAWAWGELKKQHPDATYTIYENKDGLNYHTDGRTCWVKTGVTVCGIEHIEYLPVMDNRNKSIPCDTVTSTDVNKAIQRSLTKACARHGLGLYIYAGEDLPENASSEEQTESKPLKKATVTKITVAPPKPPAKEQIAELESLAPSKPPTKEQIAELESLGGSLEKIAIWAKTTADKVTGDEVQMLITARKNSLKKAAQAKEAEDAKV